MQPQWRDRLEELQHEWQQARRDHPRVLIAAVTAVCLVAVATIGGTVWFVSGLRSGLPDNDATARIGVMDQATSVLDVHDELAFTIYKQQRVDVQLSERSPNLTRAIISLDDHLFDEHPRSG